LDLDTAIKAHAEWKTRLRAAMSGKQQLDAASIGKDNQCPLGKWLHGEAKAKYAGLKSYGPCVSAHAAFHVEAGKVAALINGAKYAEAEAALGGGTPYSSASSAVGVAILNLRKDASL
jgi:methyl-accepting chemotaxis protein